MMTMPKIDSSRRIAKTTMDNTMRNILYNSGRKIHNNGKKNSEGKQQSNQEGNFIIRYNIFESFSMLPIEEAKAVENRDVVWVRRDSESVKGDDGVNLPLRHERLNDTRHILL